MKNMLYSISLLFVISLALTLTGCQSQDKAEEVSPLPTRAPVSVTPARPFSEPISADRYELPSGAVATWRKFSGNRPALLLFSAHPLLEPLDERTVKDVRKLIATGSDAEVIRRGQLLVPDPAFFPLQTLSAALESSLFSELIVVLPLRGAIEDIPLDKIRAQVVSSGFLTEEESAGLQLENGVITGKVRGVPLRLVHPDALPEIDKPLILHIDLGYFKNLYASEIKTPANTLLAQTIGSIRDRHYPCIAATLSCSNQEIGLSLDSRFIIRYLADILANPARLDEQPKSWGILAEYRYLNNMYMESKARELLIQNEVIGKDDPAYLFALATAQFQERQSATAFATLDRAVALDAGYGLEYLNLAQRGESLGQPGKVIELFNKASEVFPNDPFIRMQLAEFLIQTGHGKKARDIINALEKLPWSEWAHGDIPAKLDELGTQADALPENPPQGSSTPVPSAQPAKTPGAGHFH